MVLCTDGIITRQAFCICKVQRYCSSLAIDLYYCTGDVANPLSHVHKCDTRSREVYQVIITQFLDNLIKWYFLGTCWPSRLHLSRLSAWDPASSTTENACFLFSTGFRVLTLALGLPYQLRNLNSTIWRKATRACIQCDPRIPHYAKRNQKQLSAYYLEYQVTPMETAGAVELSVWSQI